MLFLQYSLMKGKSFLLDRETTGIWKSVYFFIDLWFSEWYTKRFSTWYLLLHCHQVEDKVIFGSFETTASLFLSRDTCAAWELQPIQKPLVSIKDFFGRMSTAHTDYLEFTGKLTAAIPYALAASPVTRMLRISAKLYGTCETKHCLLYTQPRDH
jgi:hypothetical protein